MDRIKSLEDAYQSVTAYTSQNPWRPGLIDLIVFDYMISMHEMDGETDEYLWTETPDHVMQSVLDSNYMFTLEYGLEDLWEQVRLYTGMRGFVKSLDDAE